MNKLLIIDDDPILLRTMRALLKDKYTILITTSPNEALSIIEKHSPELILLDYDMPVLNGLQTLELIRENHNYDNIPVIFLTGTEDISILEKLQQKSIGTLKKPVKENELSDLISKHL